MRSPRRHAVVLVLVLGVVALLAQVAGVGTTRTAPRAAKVARLTLATLPGGAVPDEGSTTLASTKRTARAGEVVQMSGEAGVVARRIGASGAAQVVCGLRYSRDKDPGWTLGSPYDTIVLTKSHASEQVVIERSFTAPARDTYRVSMACHVSSPTSGARITASGSTRVELGLPDGAATPVA